MTANVSAAGQTTEKGRDMEPLDLRLQRMAGLLMMGEKIPFGSDAQIMIEAAEVFKRIHCLAREFDEMHEHVDSRYVCERISFALYGG